MAGISGAVSRWPSPAILTPANAPALPWVEGIDHVELTGHRTDATTITVHEPAPDCTCSPDHYLQPHDDDCPTLTGSPVTDEQRGDLDDAVREALHDAWTAGDTEHDYKTGAPWAREVADDLQFTEDGEPYP